MRCWQEDKAWSDAVTPEIKRILGEHLIGESPMEEDQKHNTDLMVLCMKPLRIACRVRREEYRMRYPNEFTIRSSRPDVRTELEKMLEGWGTHLFYGFSDGVKLTAWTLADLSVFRSWWCDYVARCGWPPGRYFENADGSSGFKVFEWSELPDNFIVARLDPNADVDLTALLASLGK